jgi:hypothetical protein
VYEASLDLLVEQKPAIFDLGEAAPAPEPIW